jgi:hypothetical protein
MWTGTGMEVVTRGTRYEPTAHFQWPSRLGLAGQFVELFDEITEVLESGLNGLRAGHIDSGVGEQIEGVSRTART